MEKEPPHRERRDRDPYPRARAHDSPSANSRHHRDSGGGSQRNLRDEPQRPKRVRPRDRTISDDYRVKHEALFQDSAQGQRPRAHPSAKRPSYTVQEPLSSKTRPRDQADRLNERENHYQHKRRFSGRPLLDPEKNEPEYRDSRPRRRDHRNPRDASRSRKKRPWRWRWIIVLLVVLLLALIIGLAVGIPLSRQHKNAAGSQGASGPPSGSQGDGNANNTPESARGTYYDTSTWLDTTDFNLTYTEQKVGGLPVMGLNASYNDNTRANSGLPALNDQWAYGKTPIRGMNIGGWLSLEPFITPSLFSNWSISDNIVDEWTLSAKLGARDAAYTIEKHYASFVTEDTFADIAAAGFDHVRICFSYWAIVTFPDDPYVPMISWRYLLRGIEWARKHGLRVNLDLHGVPGSQNGNNHSGRQGPIGWLNGTDGALNAERTIDIHRQLSAFFAQPRYINIVTLYGIVNEPRMVNLDVPTVLNWTSSAISVIRDSALPASVILVVSDGFLALPFWHNALPAGTDMSNLLLDAHQYVIFNDAQLALNHSSKLSFACNGWSQQAEAAMNPDTGFGSFVCGEWSQADTDCATYLNNVGVGSRWEGTLDTGNESTSVLTPTCYTGGLPPCDCTPANAEPSVYSQDYKDWLKMNAEAQMQSFEKGWGWFYWTWYTETATQWSWKTALDAGIVPSNAAKPGWQCGSDALSIAAPRLILYLPHRPAGGTSNESEDSPGRATDVTASTLAISSSAPVVKVNYRASRKESFPTPIHDVLAAYDWAIKHLTLRPVTSEASRERPHALDRNRDSPLPATEVGVLGRGIGGSLGLMLALTECKVHERARVAAVHVEDPICDWSDLDHLKPGTATATPASTVKRRSRNNKGDARASAPTTLLSHIAGSSDASFNRRTLLNLRASLFPTMSPWKYFDPFASPLLFLRTPAKDVPSPRSLGDEFTRLMLADTEAPDGSKEKEDRGKGRQRRRKVPLKWPPPGSADMVLPRVRVTVSPNSEDDILKTQSEEMVRLMRRALVRGSVTGRGVGDRLWERLEEDEEEDEEGVPELSRVQEEAERWVELFGRHPSAAASDRSSEDETRGLGLWFDSVLR
ncbi:MAG: hypothetical protein M1828_000610 [Chrysothrix sp. TS-e1954]|nr:MAG: hypothetical protein M1828_000610 [Chrysothrix sp. TS-e1954]